MSAWQAREEVRDEVRETHIEMRGLEGLENIVVTQRNILFQQSQLEREGSRNSAETPGSYVFSTQKMSYLKSILLAKLRCARRMLMQIITKEKQEGLRIRGSRDQTLCSVVPRTTMASLKKKRNESHTGRCLYCAEGRLRVSVFSVAVMNYSCLYCSEFIFGIFIDSLRYSYYIIGQSSYLIDQGHLLATIGLSSTSILHRRQFLVIPC
jgi:hypothetical protein